MIQSTPMKKTFIIALGIIIISALLYILLPEQKINTGQDKSLVVEVTPKLSPIATVAVKTPPEQVVLSQGTFVGQTFNNCGPASLSILMSMFGTNVSQEELADKMRPFHNPLGGVDDKSIFAEEFVTYAKQYGFEALNRPNGDIELLKKLLANDVPIVVRTWLHPNEDIGHFRIVRGYDDARRVIIQDDSYEGPNLEYDYDTFLSMWKPFNYGYILVYPQDKKEVVEAILAEEMDEKTAWKNALERAQDELKTNPSDSYALFNSATAEYYLGNVDKAISYYEKAVSGLPSRMLWYQLEPIYAYQQNGQYDIVFTLTDRILNNGNLAYSELYLIRGEIYKAQGNISQARSEFEKAVYYNTSLQKAQDALSSLQG